MENNNNFRTSPYSKETNNLRVNRMNNANIAFDNNSNENSIGRNTNRNNQNNEYVRKKDFIINVSLNCCTPYFTFGKTTFFYCPNSIKSSSTRNLSQMPDPPFSIGPECKFILIFIFLFKR